MKSSSANVVQIKAKMPADTKDWLQDLAHRNCSTVTAELVRIVRAAKEREESAARR